MQVRNPTDIDHRPSWLSAKHQSYAASLFSKGIHPNPILVAGQLNKLKGSAPQVAFAGRSNVGKSTLLNTLLHGDPDPLRGTFMPERRKLDSPFAAPISHKPGRTRHLFRFDIGGALTLVDLPGYGFAKAPRAVQASWATLIDEYLTQAQNLRRVISLVDAKVGVRDSDEKLWEMLLLRKRQLMVVVTKIDQVPPEGLNHTMAHLVSLLQGLDEAFIWPYVHAVSGLHGHGVDELRTSVSAIALDSVVASRRK